MSRDDGPVQLVALAGFRDEIAARQALAVRLAGVPHPDGQPWSQVPVRSIIAFLLLKDGHFEQALEMAAAALRSASPDSLGLKIVQAGRLQLYSQAVQAVYKKRPDIARSKLGLGAKLLGDIVDLAAERSLGELIAYADAAAGGSGGPIMGAGRPTVIHLGVWGEHFVDAALRTFLPCALAPGNVPKLARFGPVHIQVHTRDADIGRFESHPAVRELSRYADFQFTPFPEQLLAATPLIGGPFWRRMLQGVMQYEGLMSARRRGADFVPMMADILMSDGCLSAAKELLVARNYQAVLTTVIRASAAQIRQLLEQRGYCATPGLAIPAEALYRASLEAINRFTLDSFMRREPQSLSADPVQFYFPTPRGFVAYSGHLNPTMLATARVPADLLCDMHTVDTRLLSDMLPGADRPSACFIHQTQPGNMYYVGLEDDDKPATSEKAEMSPAGAAAAILSWIGRYEDFEYFIWTLGQRVEFPLPAGVELDLPPDCRDEAPTIAEIAALMKARRMAVFADLERYRRRN